MLCGLVVKSVLLRSTARSNSMLTILSNHYTGFLNHTCLNHKYAWLRKLFRLLARTDAYFLIIACQTYNMATSIRNKIEKSRLARKTHFTLICQKWQIVLRRIRLRHYNTSNTAGNKKLVIWLGTREPIVNICYI